MADLPPELVLRIMRMTGAVPPGRDIDGTEGPIGKTLDMLASLGVVRVVYRLEGGGDEGDTMLEEVVYEDGRTEESLPQLPTGFDTASQVMTLDRQLEDHASEAPDIDWVNNEGGSGTVTYSPKAEIGERIEVDVESNPDHDDDDDEDYEIGEDD